MSDKELEQNDKRDSSKSYKIPDELKPIIERLPEPQREAVVAILLGISIKRFSSPIPPPEVLKDYNDAIPSGAERILKMAENQSKHRIEIEKLVIKSQQIQSGRGQNYALIIALSFLVAAFVLAFTGREVSGTIIGTVDIVSLVFVFVTGRLSQKRDLENKR